MVEHKLKKIGEILDNIANHNISKFKHFDSELDKRRRQLDKKHDKLMNQHRHLDKRHSMIKQKHTNLKLQEKEYTKILGMKKGLDRKSKKLAKLHTDIKEKRANFKDRLFQEKLKIEQRYLEKEQQLQNFMTDLEAKDKKLNKDIISLEVERVKLFKSLSTKKKPEKLVPGSAIDLWPMKMATGMQQSKSIEYEGLLKDIPNAKLLF